ncbi:MAG: oxidoreductase [Actinomycetia bacterium]|nr:oxidoreductase [Actinomycetes bacterium]
MADAAPRNPWKTATVVGIRPETPRAKTLRLKFEQPVEHMAGQYFIVRLTAPDGYTAQRSYSCASPPDGSNELELTIELLDGGEVSTYLHNVVEAGDELDVRGPIGLWFVWNGDHPACMIGGGSGVVPLMAMLRYARTTGKSDLVRLLVSVRSPADLYYADELPGPETTVIYTRQNPPGVNRASGRLRMTDVPEVADDATVYVCGSPDFCDSVTDLLIGNGVLAERIRVERFGPTGD